MDIMDIMNNMDRITARRYKVGGCGHLVITHSPASVTNQDQTPSKC